MCQNNQSHSHPSSLLPIVPRTAAALPLWRLPLFLILELVAHYVVQVVCEAMPSNYRPPTASGGTTTKPHTHTSHIPPSSLTPLPQHLLRSVPGPEGEVKLHPRGSPGEAEGQQVLLRDDMTTGELSD